MATQAMAMQSNEQMRQLFTLHGTGGSRHCFLTGPAGGGGYMPSYGQQQQEMVKFISFGHDADTDAYMPMACKYAKGQVFSYEGRRDTHIGPFISIKLVVHENGRDTTVGPEELLRWDTFCANFSPFSPNNMQQQQMDIESQWKQYNQDVEQSELAADAKEAARRAAMAAMAAGGPYAGHPSMMSVSNQPRLPARQASLSR